MAREWQCVLVDRDTLGTETEQVIVVDQERSVLHGRERMLVCSLPYRDTQTMPFQPRARMKVWYGWRDAGDWDDDDELFVGYIQDIDKSMEGGEIVYTLYVADADLLLDTTTVRGFPPGSDPLYTDEFGTPHIREYHIPPTASDPLVGGYPSLYTPADWIVGLASLGKPFDGLLPTFLPDVIIPDIADVDPAYTSVTLARDSRAGNTSILGHMEGLSLRGAIEMVLVVTGVLRQALGTPLNFRPFYGFRPRAVGSRIVPEFFLRDLGVDGTPDWYFSSDDTTKVRWEPGDDPATTVYAYIKEGFKVTIRGRNLRNNVVVFGVGSDFSSVNEFDETLYKRVIGEQITGLDDYPTEYQRIPGWAGEPIITDLPKSELAYQFARVVQYALSTPATLLTLPCFVPVKKGDVISIEDEPTGTSGIFPVLDTDSGGIVRQYTLQCGWEKPTVTDLLNGPLYRLLALAGQGITPSRRVAGLNFNNPNVPTPRGLNGAPNNSFDNAVQALSDGVVGLELRGAPNTPVRDSGTGDPIAGLTPDKMPIDPDEDNYAADFRGTPPLRPSLDTTVGGSPNPDYYIFPTPRYYTRDDATGLILEMDWQDGFNHPLHYHYSFDEDGHEDVFLPTAALIATVAVTREYDESNNRVTTPTATASLLLQNATTTAMDPLGGAAVDSLHPLFLKPADNRALQVVISGLAAGHTCKVEVSERNIDPRFFGLTI